MAENGHFSFLRGEEQKKKNKFCQPKGKYYTKKRRGKNRRKGEKKKKIPQFFSPGKKGFGKKRRIGMT
ncbi:hypothetical protein H9X85_05160 [Anaerotignum lactatifermentans]|nr:hypothetical protein [Anaerotignum lactatifermentans]MBM6829165.1 hypothetical protein [Anaerotignum lactatifermentans]MBM6950601.1 hypothetical protein [Anaerotignum lactatifermentans]